MDGAIDVRDMAIVHRTFRRTFDESARLVRASAGAPPDRVTFLGEHVRFGLHTLHHHHEAEDRHLWPVLLERAPEQAQRIREVADQHTLVAAGVERAEQALSFWERTPDERCRTDLADALETLTVDLVAHLDDEEHDVVPLAAAVMTQREWEAIGESSRAAIPRDKLLLAFGALLEPLTAEEQKYMLSGLPAPVRVLWRTVGRRSYATYRRRLLAA